MKLIVITPETTAPDETEWVSRLFEGGLERLHLRKKDYSMGHYHAYLEKINPVYHARITIHEQFDLIKKYPAIGLHCKNHVLHDITQMNRILELSPASLSASVHSWREIENNTHPLDYVFISPVFDSISKKGYKASIDLQALLPLREAALKERQRGLPQVIALGGVDLANIHILHEAGFDGIALLGAIWEAPDPVAAFEKIRDKVITLN